MSSPQKPSLSRPPGGGRIGKSFTTPFKGSLIYPPLQFHTSSTLTMLPDQQVALIVQLNRTRDRLSITHVHNSKVISGSGDSGVTEYKLSRVLDRNIDRHVKCLNEKSIIVYLCGAEEWCLMRIDLLDEGNSNIGQVKWTAYFDHRIKNKNWCIDYELDQIFVHVNNCFKVLSVHDGVEISSHQVTFQQGLTCLDINRADSNQLIAVSNRHAEISYVDKKSFKILYTVNVESQMLSLLHNSLVYSVQSMSQDGRGKVHLAVHWYSPAIKAHSGIYDSSYYVVTLSNDKIISLEKNVTTFYTKEIAILPDLKMLLRMDNDGKLYSIRLKEFTLFDKVVSGQLSDVSIVGVNKEN